MNWLLIVVVALLVWNLYSGHKKGLMRVLFSLFSWILVFGICYFGAPIAADMLIEHTDIEIVIAENIANSLNEAVDYSGADVSGYEGMETALPQEVKDMLAQKGLNLDEILRSMLGGAVDVLENPGNALVDNKGIVHSIVVLIASVIVLIIAKVAVTVIDLVLGIASKLPLIGSVDKTLGTVFGGVKGLIWCWLLLAVVGVLALTGTNTELMAMVNESEILTFLYNHNIIMNMMFNSL